MKCNQCGHENKSGAKFCDNCGASISANHCPECGAINRSGAQFCQECGATIKGAPKSVARPTNAVRKPGLSPIAIVFIVLGGLVVLGGGVLFMLRDSINIPFLSSSKNGSSTETPQAEVAKVAFSINPAPIVEIGEPFELVYDWNASTEEQVKEFIENAQQVVQVNGEVVTAKVTYGSVIEDLLNGGFKTQVSTNVGVLPVGKSTVETDITLIKPVSNGTDMFGPGTEKEHVHKRGKVVVNDPANPTASAVDHTPQNCPPPEDLQATEIIWEGDKPALGIINKQGWEPYVENVGNPAIFSSGSYPWAHPVCQVIPDDPTIMVCEGEYDQPAPMKDQIGIYLPFPWSKNDGGYCIFEDPNLKQAEPVAECPPQEEIIPGELYWDEGFATLEIENPYGWEPYQEQEGAPSFLAVNDELYTNISCEVDGDDSTIMTCQGPGTIKTGGIGMLLNIPFSNQYCPYAFEKIGIKDICRVGSRFCVFSGACCPDSQTCDVNGCHSGHDDHDDH